MISKTVLDQAVEQGLLQESQVDPLLNFLNEHNASTSATTNVFYYLGGGLAVIALMLLLGLSFDRYSGVGLMIVAGISMALAAIPVVTMKDMHKGRPASLFALLIVLLVPVLVYGAQHVLGWWPEGLSFFDSYQKGLRLILGVEVVTLACAILLLCLCRYTLLVLPVVVLVWLIAVSGVDLFYGDARQWYTPYLTTQWVGLAMLGAAFVVDTKLSETKDYAFWVYIAGAVFFWGGFTFNYFNGGMSAHFYFAINLVLIALGTVLGRKVCVLAGAFGAFVYVMYLADYFVQGWLFMAILALVGVIIIGVGIFWQQHEQTIGHFARKGLPQSLRESIEHRQGL